MTDYLVDHILQVSFSYVATFLSWLVACNVKAVRESRKARGAS